MPELFIQKENTNPLFTNPDQTLIVQKTKLPNWHSPPKTLKALLGKDGLLRYDFIVDVHGAITTTLYAGYDRLRSLRFRSILANVAAQSWSDQPFEVAFRELNDATKFEQSLSLSDTVQMLDRRVHTEGEKVEIFGAKVPLNIITSLGGLIVVCCQLYLWGHLRELTRLLSNEREEAEVTGYIGLYRDVLMKALTVLSVSFLPPAIEVLLIRKKPSEFRWCRYAGFDLSRYWVAFMASFQPTLENVRNKGNFEERRRFRDIATIEQRGRRRGLVNYPGKQVVATRCPDECWLAAWSRSKFRPAASVEKPVSPPPIASHTILAAKAVTFTLDSAIYLALGTSNRSSTTSATGVTWRFP